MKRISVLVVALCLLAPACADATDERESSPSTITGVVIEVEDRGFDEVTGFVVRSRGAEYDIAVNEGTEFDFAPSHLRSHLVSGEPVMVWVEGGEDDLTAVSVTDG